MFQKMSAWLHDLPRTELVKKWQEIFPLVPISSFRKEFLIKHIIWEMQAREQSGYTAKTIKQLEILAKDLDQNPKLKSHSLKILMQSNLRVKTGTKLLREYKGINHEVLVLEQGFQYNNKIYKSLSAIANKITGSRWNGKVFFGLKK